MAKRRSKPAGYDALLRRYAHQIDAIRDQYEARASELERERRALESDYTIMLRQYRHEIAELKRHGLVPKTVSARSARPTSALSRRLNDLYDVVIGKKRAQRVDKPTARRLRSQGFQTVGERVILSPRLSVKKGQVVETRTRAGRAIAERPITGLRLGGARDLDRQIDRLFERMKPGEYLGLDLGDNYSRLFSGNERERFRLYVTGGGSFNAERVRRVLTFTIGHDEADDYLAARRDLREERDADRREAAASRRRRRRRVGKVSKRNAQRR
jgi:hypothetical protein